jgi:hypothetical protein
VNPCERAGSWQSRPQEQQLLLNIKDQLPELEKLLHEVESHWGMEDTFYRFTICDEDPTTIR